jgi:hypothetical protein
VEVGAASPAHPPNDLDNHRGGAIRTIAKTGYWARAAFLTVLGKIDPVWFVEYRAWLHELVPVTAGRLIRRREKDV